MDRTSRKAAIAAYKKRERQPGIFAVRCTAAEQTWVGRAHDLARVQTRLWFGLRHDGRHHPAMQDAWNAHGETAFTFEIVEAIDDEELDFVLEAKLKDRLAFWRESLSAKAI